MNPVVEEHKGVNWKQNQTNKKNNTRDYKAKLKLILGALSCRNWDIRNSEVIVMYELWDSETPFQFHYLFCLLFFFGTQIFVL